MYDSDKVLKNCWDILSTLVHQPRKFRGQRQSSPPAADTDTGPPLVHSSRPDACPEPGLGSPAAVPEGSWLLSILISDFKSNVF